MLYSLKLYKTVVLVITMKSLSKGTEIKSKEVFLKFLNLKRMKKIKYQYSRRRKSDNKMNKKIGSVIAHIVDRS